MAASMKMATFWVVAPSSPMTDRESTSETSVNFTRLDGATTQKTANLILNQKSFTKYIYIYIYARVLVFSPTPIPTSKQSYLLRLP
jgi:hypothetical protein